MSPETEKRRILFVDDDQAILDGLRRLLRPMRKRWELTFALGGQAGLDELDSAPPDVLVTDIRMPGIDGTRVLAHARDHHPHVVRVVLSGHTELEEALRTLPVAHRFLTKPCDPHELESVVERAFCLTSTLGDTRIENFVRTLEIVPSAPEVYQAIVEELARPDSSVRRLAEVAERDMGLCARILQLVNSAYFSLPRQISSIESAVSYLGGSMLRNLVLSFEVQKWLGERPEPEGFSTAALQSRSLLAAQMATHLVEDPRQKEEAFTAAMLVDAGQLVLAAIAPREFTEILALARQGSVPTHELEKAEIGVTHCEVGAYLFGLWGLPYSIVEAVAYHHTPALTPSMEFDVLGAVHVSDFFARELTEPDSTSGMTEGGLDATYLERVGRIHHVEAMREIAHRNVDPAAVTS